MAAGISTFFGLQTALRGLQAQQAGLNVTAHNIANADTVGYTRQNAQLEAVTGLKLNAGALAGGAGAFLGGGVDVTAYRRARDAFADLQYRTQSSVKGESSTTAQTLESVELALNEPGENGISTLLSRFWDSWQEVANHPEDAATKSALVVNAKALADGIKALDAQLAQIQAHAADEFTALTSVGGDILANAQTIARLNADIKDAVMAGRQPNELLDERDRLIDRLSELGQVTVTELGNGSIQIAFGNVSTPLLVDDETAWAPTPPATTLYPTPSPGGIIGALQTLSQPGGTLDTYRGQLDAFVNQLVTDVNTAHGAPFFDAGGLTASTIAVDAGIAANPSTVRTTNVVGSPEGANDVALAVAALRAGTADRGYAGFVLKVGSESRDAQRRTAAAEAVVAAAMDRRSATSGVSLDEEMANMMRFQRGYQASARTMSTLDEMLDVLINRTGRVGL
ncbi:MAG TPA: flagellar hook-associated protein FlgK [Capillimicrobium sp.]|nr:flagellar hook-associated protein FlgK [Capillimicrobium sp.]